MDLLDILIAHLTNLNYHCYRVRKGTYVYNIYIDNDCVCLEVGITRFLIIQISGDGLYRRSCNTETTVSSWTSLGDGDVIKQLEAWVHKEATRA